MTPRLSARDDQKLEVGVEVSGQDGSSACLEEEMNNISSLGSAGSSSDNYMQMEETNGEADKDPLWNPDSVPRRKRSELRQHNLSPVERLQRQLYNILQEPDFTNISANDEDILIYEKNKYIPPNEIGVGAMLHVSPTITTEHSTSLAPMAEDNASCSVNAPEENSYLINNNVLDHVAMQNETTGNEGGKAKARENRLAPHHMDTTSRVSRQKLYSQRARCRVKVGHQVNRPRGRPRLSTTQGRYFDKDRRSETADESLQAWSSSLIDVPIYSVNWNDSTAMSAIKGMKVDTVTVNMENNLNEHIVEDQTQIQRLEPQMAKMGIESSFHITSDEK
ncbi:hypothetical protein K7X08_014593 [Anisodus acutangulus]|uniref:Uncharacterized protein n=1 Tax=Anisodus acutangulus TaxID=402998 RepID=A0A9Q1LIT8_9SOLA|nr:hypothetical protein K7X08_014593 [Anisodus acutangulus]